MTEIKRAEKRNKITKADLPNELRRTLLKTSWVIPAITVVGLPAHAQTSPTTTTTTTTSCPQELTIPSRTVTCDPPPGTHDVQHYLIDDTATPCPSVIQGSEDNFSIGANGSRNDYNEISVGAGNNNSGQGISQTCGNPSPNQEISHSMDVTAASGAPWTAAFTVSRDATSVTLSDIVLTPQ